MWGEQAGRMKSQSQGQKEKPREREKAGQGEAGGWREGDLALAPWFGVKRCDCIQEKSPWPVGRLN